MSYGRRRATAPALIAAALLALCGTVQAADSHEHRFSESVTETYDGTWTATFDPKVGPTGTAKFILADFAGTWQDVGAASVLKGHICAGKPMPVTVQVSQKEEFGFTVFGSSVAPTCPTLTVYVKPVDANSLEGTVESTAFAGEQKIRLVRTPQAPRRR
jgi:hypothetical protein